MKTSCTDFKCKQTMNRGTVKTSKYFDTFMVTKHNISGTSYSLLSAQVSSSLLPRGSQSLAVIPFSRALTSDSEAAPLPCKGPTAFHLRPARLYVRRMERWAGEMHSALSQRLQDKKVGSGEKGELGKLPELKTKGTRVATTIL